MMVYCKLKKLMDEKGINMVQLEEATGLSRNVISKMYHDHNAMFTRDTLNKLCAYFNIGIGELLEFVPDKAA